jgi:hypothetical protein
MFRIGWVLEIYRAEHLRGKAEVRKWRVSCAVTGPYTHKYILYMQQTGELYPFLSIFDRLLLSHAWKAGSESSALEDTSHDRIDRSCS